MLDTRASRQKKKDVTLHSSYHTQSSQKKKTKQGIGKKAERRENWKDIIRIGMRMYN